MYILIYYGDYRYLLLYYKRRIINRIPIRKLKHPFSAEAIKLNPSPSSARNPSPRSPTPGRPQTNHPSDQFSLPFLVDRNTIGRDRRHTNNTPHNIARRAVNKKI